MDVGGTNPYSSAIVSSLGPIHGSFSGAQTDGLSSLQQSAEGLVSSDYLDSFKQGKSRKPYTISKQRERWSEEEHQRFVEAVKTYGRQWRRIEEHIGSKTAVQIRSHAQKFFNKLEKKKEAGEMPDKDEDIAIPPPRPKRKPSKPYPRKDGLTSSGLTGTSQPQASSQLPTDSQLPPALQSGLQQHASLQQQQQPQAQGLLFQQQPAQQHQQQPQTPFGLPHSLGMSLEGLLHNFDSLATASSLASGQQQQMQPQLQQQQHPGEVADATVAAVTAAASAAAAAAAAAVVAAAGQEVQMHMQAHPPSCFPFFGLPPSAFAQLAPVAPALDQAVIAAEQAAAATAAAYRFGGSAAAVAAAAAAATAPAMAAANAAAAAAAAEAEDMVVDEDGARGDKHLVEATGTTDGTHISAYAQLRGSDGDSACSRETDNQDPDADVNMDVTWQGKLHEQQQHSLQHGGLASGSPAATAARALSGLPGGAFNPSALQWGLGAAGLCAPGAADAGSAAAAAASMLSALGPAQVLALLSNPMYFANQHMNQQAHAAAAAAAGDAPEAEVTPHRAAAAAAAGRSSGGADVSSGGVGGAGGNSTRSKSRRTAPSVNSGSTGPPVGTKRAHEDGSEGAPAAKKVVCEVSDTNDEGEQVSPGSSSIQEKHIKAASQPSNTNGNTSGSNESDASKRRQGMGQGEGSNPNSVKDSNTATQTNGSGNGSGNGNGYTNGNGTNGNGTSAFHFLGHHHHAHAHGHPHKPTKTHGSCAVAAAGVAKAPASHHHAHHHHANTQDAGGEGSNGGNGMSGINNGMSGTNNNTSGTNDGANGKDEGRSSSDLEGPTQQQVLQRHHMQQEQAAAEEDTAGGQLQQQQQPAQDSTAAAQLQALLANLHGMCGPSPLMQAYSAAAAAAAKQMLANALQHIPNGAVAGHDMQQQQQQQQQQHAVGQLLAALQQQMAQSGSNGLHMPAHLHAAGSQGFAPWHAASTAAGPAFGVGSSNALPAASGLPALAQQSEAAASAQLAAAAAGLMGLGGAVWGGSSAATTSVGARAAGVNLPLNPYAQVAAGLQQQQQYHQRSLSAASAAVAAAAAAGGGYQSNQAAAAVAVQQHLQSGLASTQHGAFGGMSAAAAAAALGGHFPEMSGLELLSRAAQSAGGLLGGDDGASGQLVHRRQARAARSSDHQVPKARQPTHTL